ncbi:hypothetical protein NMD1_02960 [Novosphingobium sp. MD-1]|nr:hypothetical protein NMD1_02960 [Novosphingobium sp. MD-1]
MLGIRPVCLPDMDSQIERLDSKVEFFRSRGDVYREVRVESR